MEERKRGKVMDGEDKSSYRAKGLVVGVGGNLELLQQALVRAFLNIRG